MFIALVSLIPLLVFRHLYSGSIRAYTLYFIPNLLLNLI